MNLYMTQKHRGEPIDYVPLLDSEWLHIDMPTVRVWSDEEIEYWAQTYRDNNVRACGISFEAFIERPHDILEALAANGHIEGDDYLPLLPVQERVRRRIDLRTPAGLLEELERNPHIINRNGTYVEPLHHHAHPRNKRRIIS